MMLPWVARSSHQAMVALLSAEVSELKAERKTLLDRLVVLALGAPLYGQHADPSAETAVLEEDGAAEASGEEQGLVEELLRLRRRPAKLADALTRSLRRPQSKQPPGPRVAWIPDGDPVKAALDQAEEMGRRNISLAG